MPPAAPLDAALEDAVRAERGRNGRRGALVGFVGPFLNYFCFFNALKRLEVSRVSVIRAGYSVVVLIGAFLIYDQLPSQRQIAGGLLVLTGVGLMVLEKGRLAKLAAAAAPAPPR